MSPEISILLPFQHLDDKLSKAVKSIRDQSFSHWELLLLHNGPLPSDFESWKPDMESDSRIKVFHLDKQGIAAALNFGLEKAVAPLIARMDADDLSYPDRLTKQVKFLLDNPDYDVVSTQVDVNEDAGEGMKAYVDWQNQIISREDHLSFRFMESPLVHPSVCFRKSLIKHFGVYSEDELPEDYDLWMRWLSKGVRFYKIPERLFCWQDHPARQTRTHSNYDTDRFLDVKIQHLKPLLDKRPKLICGSGKEVLSRLNRLESKGIQVDAYTDTNPKPGMPIPFVAPNDLQRLSRYQVLSLVAHRDARMEILRYFERSGFTLNKDFFALF